MKRFLLATLLAASASGPLAAQCSDNCNTNGGWYGNAKGLPKYVDKPKSDSRNNDQALTIMAVAGGVLISLVAFACFFRESLALSGPRPQRPWDV